MKRNEKQIAERRAIIQTLLAVAAVGGRFYDSLGLAYGETSTKTLAEHVSEWVPVVRFAVVSTYKEACKVQAFSIERDDGSGAMRGYRLFRLGGGPSGTGHLYSGETFRTADDLWSAMRTIGDLQEHPACQVTAPPAEVKVRSIVVVGFHWRDKKAGNTYHRAQVIVDGETMQSTPFAYGGGSMYEESAAEWLETAGILPVREKHASGGKDPLWRACEAAGIKLARFSVDVASKKDMGA